MPKRIVDGEGLWSSDKLARVEPEWVRAEYANLLPLALANGVFELSAKKIWRTVYAYNRPSMTEKKVELVLEKLEQGKLLFRFEASGQVWGYWTGIERPGRLPSPDRREKQGPPVPVEELQRFLCDAMCGTVHHKCGNVRHSASSTRASARPSPNPNPSPIPNPSAASGEGIPELPGWVPEREWRDFVAMRLTIRKPIKTATQALYCVRRLAELRDQGNDPAAVLAQSIAGNWQGLFPLKGQSNARPDATEQTRRNAAIALERMEAREKARAAGAGHAE